MKTKGGAMGTEITPEMIRDYHDWLESIEFVDEEGNVVDVSNLELHDDDDDEELTAEEEADAMRLMGEDEVAQAEAEWLAFDQD